MRATFVAGHRMNLIQYHRLNGLEHATTGLRCQQYVQRLRRRDEDVGWTPPHPRPLALGRVPRADHGANRCVGESALQQHVANTDQRYLQVLLNVVGQRLQGRYVEDTSLVLQAALERMLHERVDHAEKGSESLAGSRRGRDQRVSACLYGLPGPELNGRRRRELPLKPA